MADGKPFLFGTQTMVFIDGTRDTLEEKKDSIEVHGFEMARDLLEGMDGPRWPGLCFLLPLLEAARRSSRTPEEEGRGGLGQERKDLYSLTPMEQFEKLQMMMDQATTGRGLRPGASLGGDRGRATRASTSREQIGFQGQDLRGHPDA